MSKDIGLKIQKYIQLRDLRDAAKADFTNKMKPLHEAMESMESEFLQHLTVEGVESLKTKAGTVFTNTKSSASVSDKEEFMNHVRKNNAWELLDIKANKTAVRDSNSEGIVIPGVKYTETKTAQVRRGK